MLFLIKINTVMAEQENLKMYISTDREIQRLSENYRFTLAAYSKVI